MDWIYQWLASMGYTHPIHPPMTYIPLGMVIGALIFGVWGMLFKKVKYALTGRHCITLAFIGTFPTIWLGYLDWQHYYGGAWLFEIQMKIILAIALALILLLAVVLHLKYPPGAAPLLLVYFLAFLTIVGLGYYGGELIFAAPRTAQAQPSTPPSEAGRPIRYDQVQPIFEQNCVKCHSGEDASKGLRLTSYESVMEGAAEHEVVVPGQPDQSELVRRIRGESEPRMPLGQPPLPDDQIERIVRWVDAGAQQ